MRHRFLSGDTGESIIELEDRCEKKPRRMHLHTNKEMGNIKFKIYGKYRIQHTHIESFQGKKEENRQKVFKRYND